VEAAKAFSPEQLRPFAEDDFPNEWNGRKLKEYFRTSRHRTEIDKIDPDPEIEELLTHIRAATRKFEFGRTPHRVWESHYKYAHRESTLYRDNSAFDDDEPVNLSYDHSQRWINETIIPYVRSDKAHHHFIALIGEVGAGKTTFNKWTSIFFQEKFAEANIISSRIEFQKLKQYVKRNAGESRESSRRNCLYRFVTACILRDFFSQQLLTIDDQRTSSQTFKIRDKPFNENIFAKITDQTSEESFRIYWEKNVTISDLNYETEFLKHYQRAYDAFSSGSLEKRIRWFFDFSNSPRALLSLSPLLNWLEDHFGKRYFVNIDGLDVIEASDFLVKTENRAIVEEIADWIIVENQDLPIFSTEISLRPRFQITCRYSTWSAFMFKYRASINDVKPLRYSVMPPSFDGIVNSLFENLNASSSAEMDGLIETYRRVNEALAEELKIEVNQIDSLFYQNIRHRKNFIANLFEVALEGAHSRSGKLYDFLIEKMIDLSGTRSYRLVQLLLYSKNQRFANFILLKGATPDDDAILNSDDTWNDVFGDNDYHSGYVANIFNYHIPSEGFRDCDVFLEKLRVVYILNNVKPGAVLTREQIRKKFLEYGWRCSKFLKSTMAILIREGFVLTEIDDFSSIAYRVSPVGEICLNSLIYSMSYVENVIFGSMLPSGIARNMKDVVRGESRLSEDWPAASVYHIYLFLRLVRTAEEGANLELFPDMHKKFLSTIEKIFESEKDGSTTLYPGEKIVSEHQRGPIANKSNKYITEFRISIEEVSGA
jgi:hypothetical protein